MNPQILLVPDNSGTVNTETLKILLVEGGFRVSILDEYTEFFRKETRELLEEYRAHHDWPAKVECLEKPKTEFEQRQEWLNGFRNKHQRRHRNKRWLP